MTFRRIPSLKDAVKCVGVYKGLCVPQRKALSLVDQFSLKNVQYMLDTLAAIRLNSKPLLDICGKKLAGTVTLTV